MISRLTLHALPDRYAKGRPGSQQGISEVEALEKCMDEKSNDFNKAGTEVYVPA